MSAVASNYRQFRASERELLGLCSCTPGLVGTGSFGLRSSGTALESSSIGIREFCTHPRKVRKTLLGTQLPWNAKIPKSTQE